MAPPRRPDPPPLPDDGVRVVALGTGLWAVALIAGLLVRGRLADQGREWWIWACLVGLLLGVYGVWYCRRRRDGLAARGKANTPGNTTADG